MVPKPFNILTFFNISAVSSIFLTFLTFQQSRAFFFKNVLETAEMLKVFFFGGGAQWFQKHLTFLTFQQFRAFF